MAIDVDRVNLLARNLFYDGFEERNETSNYITTTTSDEISTWSVPFDWQYYTIKCFLSWDEKLLKDTEVFEMYVYDVIVIDTKECEVLHRQEVIAEDEKDAMLGLDVDEGIMKLHKKGQVKFILNQLGGFNRYTRKVKIKDEDE